MEGGKEGGCRAHHLWRAGADRAETAEKNALEVFTTAINNVKPMVK